MWLWSQFAFRTLASKRGVLAAPGYARNRVSEVRSASSEVVVRRCSVA